MKANRPSLTHHIALHEWLALVVCMALLGTALGWQNGLGRWDQTLYDKFLTLNGRPAREDVIIIAIDDYSLSELGRWPWPRALHAKLLDRLTDAHARRVGLDIILSEPERPRADGTRPDDALLAQAIVRNQRVILPIVMKDDDAEPVAFPPIQEFANAAHGLGYINLLHDGDGVVRSTALFMKGKRGTEEARLPHFALALLESGLQDSAWLQAQLPEDNSAMRIPYAGNNGLFRSVPYISVLRGEVPNAFFDDKIVLIGATAIGMADAYPTPVSGIFGAMPGVEINANILAALLDHRIIKVAASWQVAFFSVLPVLLTLIAYFWFSPRIALLICGGLLGTTLAVSYLELCAGIWFPPTAACIALILSYPLWSWRRLEAAINYLGQEFIRLENEPHLLPEIREAGDSDQIEDLLERRITAMRNATQRVRDLRQFVSDNLNSLPDVTLVANTDGRVLMTNHRADTYFSAAATTGLHDVSLFDLLSNLHEPEPMSQTSFSPFAWSHLLDLNYTKALASGISAHDSQERDMLVKSAPCYSANNVLTGWIVNIIDISTIRAAERSRDETLRFLSHDMRAPQASILALLELQGEPDSALPQQDFFAKIEKASRKTLGLADNFVQLARAESHEYRLEEVDFQHILLDAIDEMWVQANGKQIRLESDIPDGEYPIWVDRGLMTRALVNLLSNAIHYSPAHTSVSGVLRRQSSNQIICHIVDHGYGIAEADQPRLFRRFQRMEQAGRTRHDGIGLGLVFVKTVTERHHGSISVASTERLGTTFTLTLPVHQG